MFESLSILQTEVDRSLGYLDRKFLSPENITAAGIETLSFYGLDAAQSQYGRAGKSVEFYPTSRRARVSKAADMAVPSYVERRVGHLPNESWQWIPQTHPSLLSESEALRCAWEQDANGLYLLFNYNPTGSGPYRLHYYTDPAIAKALEDPMGLPTRFGFLFLHASILNVITSVLHLSAQLPEDQQLNSAQLNAISAQISHSQAQVDKWTPLWKSEKSADRAPRGRNRSPVLGRMGLG